jgi:hypothetical protein
MTTLESHSKEKTFPFRYFTDPSGKVVPLVAVTSFFRDDAAKKKYEEYVKNGIPIIGITAYKSFPKPIKDGSADVYWGNCDKIYRNHPVAVAETRAEGRALRRALRLRKVVAAEELSKEIEDNPDIDSVSNISSNQINFIDVLAKRLDINMQNLLVDSGHVDKNIYNIKHSVAVDIIKNLSSYQQNVVNIPDTLKGYDVNWK